MGVGEVLGGPALARDAVGVQVADGQQHLGRLAVELVAIDVDVVHDVVVADALQLLEGAAQDVVAGIPDADVADRVGVAGQIDGFAVDSSSSKGVTSTSLSPIAAVVASMFRAM